MTGAWYNAAMAQPLPPLTAAELKQRLDAGEKLRLIHVREPNEWISELGHIEGAELMPLGSVQAKAPDVAGETREIISICKSGMRADQTTDFWAQQDLKVRVLTDSMMT